MPDAARVLITGGSGFIGANLVRAELAAGSEVHLLLRPEARLWRLSDVRREFSAHTADVRDAAAVRRVVGEVRPEVVYHLATHGAYPSQRDRGTILATNLVGTSGAGNEASARPYTKPTAPQGFKVPDGMYYNEYFLGHLIKMPPPLNDNQVTYADGTKATVPQMSLDVVTFLHWAAEPNLDARHRMGIKVILFLLVAAGLFYAAKRKIWARVH